MKVFRIVRHQDLEGASMDGWELVQTLATSRADKIVCSTPVATEGSHGSGGYVNACTRDEVVQVHEPMFMVFKEREAIDRETQLKEDVRLLKENAIALQRKSDLDDRDLKQLRAVEAAKEARLQIVSADVLNMREKMYKLEGDLAKVRFAIGAKAYDEAIK